jgi:hypothetical protein
MSSSPSGEFAVGPCKSPASLACGAADGLALGFPRCACVADAGGYDSGKCISSKRDCQYDVDRGAVKDLRVQHNVVPGMWIWQVSKFDSSDPFDAFPVEMKLRSRELFHYCKCSLTHIFHCLSHSWSLRSSRMAKI